MAQAYWLEWLIPAYTVTDQKTGVAVADLSPGYLYLGVLLIALTVFAWVVIAGHNRRGKGLSVN
jgi:hypothetical protein